jgi:hypothetical protein
MKHITTVEREISGDADSIWATISAGGDVHHWFPMIQTCRLEGSARFCVMADGSELEERIVEIDRDARRFRYAVERHPLPASNAIATIQVKDIAPGRTFISWGAEFEASEENVTQVKETLQMVYSQGIQSLESYHSTTPGAL